MAVCRCQSTLRAREKTAAIVSIIVWFLAYFLDNVSMVVYGFMPIRLTVIGTAWGLVELLLAGLIGSYLYKEKEQLNWNLKGGKKLPGGGTKNGGRNWPG